MELHLLARLDWLRSWEEGRGEALLLVLLCLPRSPPGALWEANKTSLALSSWA